ncbi:MAG: ThiF family adenylyltransferase [Christensenellales bacterium]|jgi:hypothetical protein
MKNPELEAIIKESAEKTKVDLMWKKPEVFQYNSTSDQVRMTALYKNGEIHDTFDPIVDIAESEFELLHPELRHNPKEREEFVVSILKQGNEYGEWVFNQGSLIRYPDRDIYRKLRTFRYKNLITKEEQDKLNKARPAVFGLSVGGNIAVALVRNGIGQAIALGDFDKPDVPGIGRNVTDIRDFGLSKLDAVAKQISYIDPFIEQKHFREGFHDEIKSELVEYQADALFDEIDDMIGSAAMRIFCRDFKIPYLTVADVGDRATLELIRHDLGGRKLYAGRISDRDAQRMMSGDVSDEELDMILSKSIGLSNLLAAPRLMESYGKLGVETSGTPQLGSTSLIAAGYAVMAYRNVLLDKSPKEGLTALKPDVVLKTRPSLFNLCKALIRNVRAQNSKNK